MIHELLLALGDMPVGQVPLVALLPFLPAGGHLHHLGQLCVVAGLVHYVEKQAW